MGPVRQNPIQRTVSLFICVCIALCTIVADNIAQNKPDSFPPRPPDNHQSSFDTDGWVAARTSGPQKTRSTNPHQFSSRRRRTREGTRCDSQFTWRNSR